MGKDKLNEPLKLIRWANDGYPPIDLNENTDAVMRLINEVRRLRKENDSLLSALKDIVDNTYSNTGSNMREVPIAFINSAKEEIQKAENNNI